jgi:hypothetical protein
MIIRYTAYTTSPRETAARLNAWKKRDPRGFSLGGGGGPVTHTVDDSKTILIRVPEDMDYFEMKEYCEVVAARFGWPVTEGAIEEDVSLPKVVPWDPNWRNLSRIGKEINRLKKMFDF